MEILEGNIYKFTIDGQTVWDLRDTKAGFYNKNLLKESDIIICSNKLMYQQTKHGNLINLYKKSKQKAVTIILEIDRIIKSNGAGDEQNY